ncbi:hypothetical protein K504DRAFT_374566 [Pleomassaria siparia CBS 279.74]|uniref:GIT Spa2 homology (SHD) domain-containing protein n=1 Tax=Pleomassaria siparia CBS 279.74 TaxID=1314801 RepID=A0A6G1KGT4_9PLEO|nr:hypothetical protein K504DRAFT_374566 [Pleomassaria siparia CBS 279.74]
MNGRNGTLSPVSNADSDWSPVTRYGNMNGNDNPYSPTLPYSPGLLPSNRGITPPTSLHSSATTTDGGMPNGMGRSNANGNPSPPSSVGRSSDGTGLYASSMMDANFNGRKMPMLEETLGEHYRVLKVYLAPYLTDEKGNPRPSRAKDKLTRLSAVQFQELSTDVYDESIRREDDKKRGGPGAPGNNTPNFLLPKNNFHPKRNQARQKLSTLPLERFRQLATDVYYELERRFPRFAAGDIPRMGSPAGSVASQMSRGQPSRVGTPNSMSPGPGPGPGYRNGPPPNGPPGSRSGGSRDYGRPLPKTFQQNTIVPNKGTMVEDDDEDSGADDDDAFNLEAAAARKGSKSMSLAQEKLVTELQSQLSDLQAKVESLQGDLQDKDGQIQRLSDAERSRDSNMASERAEWDDLRSSLEDKVAKAETLNSSLRLEIDKIRSENSDTERNLQAQISNLENQSRQQQASDVGNGQWRQRCEELERELSEQQHICEEVRRDASVFLQEMRELSARGDNALEKEERLSLQVASLENEVKEWKSRYAGAKTQLRTLKASSIGLASLASPDITNYTRDASFATPDGMVKDVHVTKFQLSIDELLQVARRAGPEQVLDSMRHVVKCVRAITGDLDSTSFSQLQSPGSSINGDSIMSPEKQQAKLKSRVSATANNLITASKNHASSSGLSPVSLLDAAASHLSTAVIELVKQVKIRPTPEDEFENNEEDDRPMPLKPGNGYSTYTPYSPNPVNGNGAVAALDLNGHQRHRSRGGSASTGYSTYSSPYSGYDRQSVGFNGMGLEKDSGMIDFKNFLQEQTDILVQNIGPLVNMIRSSPTSTPNEEQLIVDYVQDISGAVQDTATKTYDTVKTMSNPALKKHAPPVVEVLEECRLNLLAVDVQDGGRESILPIAFKTARALKELVLRVDRIESGELTFDQTLQTDF